eukprot:TRINITY_DN66983_c0_g3_i1.p2 TRINITY_DN66983_c0_g3~~TRINITY_DN66983_c0_g3_i1.p2  ORF type:complete len:178 (-),score=21.05 TRINITY_DN66983_c0_g3_i1:52-585(-)
MFHHHNPGPLNLAPSRDPPPGLLSPTTPDSLGLGGFASPSAGRFPTPPGMAPRPLSTVPPAGYYPNTAPHFSLPMSPLSPTSSTTSQVPSSGWSTPYGSPYPGMAPPPGQSPWGPISPWSPAPPMGSSFAGSWNGSTLPSLSPFHTNPALQRQGMPPQAPPQAQQPLQASPPKQKTD